MITLYNRQSSKFETNKRNSEVIANLVAKRNGGDRDSNDRLIDILLLINEECRGISSQVALTLLENNYRFRDAELFLSRKQCWSIACGVTDLDLDLSLDNPRGSESAKENATADVKQIKAREPVSIKAEPVVPVWTPDPNGARVGDVVEFADTETGCLMSMKIVANESRSSSEKGVICKNSPVGQALLGHIPNDFCEAITPSGSKRFQLLSIARS